MSQILLLVEQSLCSDVPDGIERIGPSLTRFIAGRGNRGIVHCSYQIVDWDDPMAIDRPTEMKPFSLQDLANILRQTLSAKLSVSNQSMRSEGSTRFSTFCRIITAASSGCKWIEENKDPRIIIAVGTFPQTLHDLAFWTLKNEDANKFRDSQTTQDLRTKLLEQGINSAEQVVKTLRLYLQSQNSSLCWIGTNHMESFREKDLINHEGSLRLQHLLLGASALVVPMHTLAQPSSILCPSLFMDAFTNLASLEKSEVYYQPFSVHLSTSTNDRASEQRISKRNDIAICQATIILPIPSLGGKICSFPRHYELELDICEAVEAFHPRFHSLGEYPPAFLTPFISQRFQQNPWQHAQTYVQLMSRLVNTNNSFHVKLKVRDTNICINGRLIVMSPMMCSLQFRSLREIYSESQQTSLDDAVLDEGQHSRAMGKLNTKNIEHHLRSCYGRDSVCQDFTSSLFSTSQTNTLSSTPAKSGEISTLLLKQFHGGYFGTISRSARYSELLQELTKDADNLVEKQNAWSEKCELILSTKALSQTSLQSQSKVVPPESRIAASNDDEEAAQIPIPKFSTDELLTICKKQMTAMNPDWTSIEQFLDGYLLSPGIHLTSLKCNLEKSLKSLLRKARIQKLLMSASVTDDIGGHLQAECETRCDIIAYIIRMKALSLKNPSIDPAKERDIDEIFQALSMFSAYLDQEPGGFRRFLEKHLLNLYEGALPRTVAHIYDLFSLPVPVIAGDEPLNTTLPSNSDFDIFAANQHLARDKRVKKKRTAPQEQDDTKSVGKKSPAPRNIGETFSHIPTHERSHFLRNAHRLIEVALSPDGSRQKPGLPEEIFEQPPQKIQKSIAPESAFGWVKQSSIQREVEVSIIPEPQERPIADAIKDDSSIFENYREAVEDDSIFDHYETPQKSLVFDAESSESNDSHERKEKESRSDGDDSEPDILGLLKDLESEEESGSS
eukprot:TRINITY_DN10160_c0_g1_i1.p1 TRINITY_DN10160_c0_g1~~TRINITY_DN10160_c0_g1_i1.p1  ORF type:complete len:956 (-),score=149.93 TRINITY_DN10160_c0_g1_i1:88-2955(-)